MFPYRAEKIQSAIAFFAEEHRKKTRKPLYQTFLFKYLAFLDFMSLREAGRPVLELVYKAMYKGPVPIEIYNDKKDTPKYKFKRDQLGEFVIATDKPDLNLFSNYEIELMQRLIEIFAEQWITTGTMSDASHENILAWKRTWAKKPNAIIEYALEFDGDLFSKSGDQLTYPEEAYLTYRAMVS